MSAPGFAGAIFLPSGEIADLVRQLGSAISEDHPDGVSIVGILKGCAVFVADLMRWISVPCEVDFLALSAYRDGAPRVQLVKDVSLDVAGSDVVLVVDVIDSGLTVNYVRRLFADRGAQSTSVCALLDRSRRRVVPADVRYRGLEIGDEYLVGYGLDLDERFRNLPYLMRIDPTALESTAKGAQVASAEAEYPL
jgi:hypoxanthine phosphoribosyltransferase